MKPGENSAIIIKTVEVNLDSFARLEVADEVGELVRQIEEKKKAFQLATAHHKALIGSLSNRQDTLLEVLASNVREVEVECRPDYDYREGTVRLINVKTEELVEERDMTAQERQMNVANFSPSDDSE